MFKRKRDREMPRKILSTKGGDITKNREPDTVEEKNEDGGFCDRQQPDKILHEKAGAKGMEGRVMESLLRIKLQNGLLLQVLQLEQLQAIKVLVKKHFHQGKAYLNHLKFNLKFQQNTHLTILV